MTSPFGEIPPPVRAYDPATWKRTTYPSLSARDSQVTEENVKLSDKITSIRRIYE